LLTVHLSIFISVINQFDAQNFCFTISLFHASTCFEHHVLIIGWSKLYYTASGVITPVGGKTVDYYIEYKRHRAIVRKMTRRQRRDDWDKFVKALERDITETQRRGFKIFKQLHLRERDKLKIDPITKTE